MNLTRREFLAALGAAPLAWGTGASAQGPAARTPLLVLVFLYGGNDGYNTWVPYTDPLYYRVRPTIAVPRDAVIKVTGSHGFHPSLAALVPAWEAKDLALVQGIGFAECTQQHYRDEEIAFTGCDDDYLTTGWITRALEGAGPRGRVVDAAAFNLLDDREADPFGPFRGKKLSVVQTWYAADLLAGRRLDARVFQATDLARSRLGASPAMPPVALRTSFPTDPFGSAMRAAVELAKLDPTLPVIHVALNGLDNDKHNSVDCHWKQLDHHGGALKRLADGLAALRLGLQEVGRWDDALVATYDEFGRSPMENGDHGTHHGYATTHFVMGGRVKGGLLGAAPAVVNMHPIGGPAPVIDTRALWSTVVERWWGGDASKVFGRRYAPLDLLRA